MTTQWIVGLLASLLGIKFQPIEQPKITDIRWQCQAITYTDGPRVTGGYFYATLTTTCDFDAVQGGGMIELDRYLNEKIVKEAETIHSGPTEVAYKNHPAKKYDVTVKLGTEKDWARIRQDDYVAGDKATVQHFDSFSTNIEGKGNASYLVKSDLEAQVLATATDRKFELKLIGSVKLDKPWYVPAGMFISKVKEAIEKNTEKVESQLITELANHL